MNVLLSEEQMKEQQWGCVMAQKQSAQSEINFSGCLCGHGRAKTVVVMNTLTHMDTHTFSKVRCLVGPTQ